MVIQLVKPNKKYLSSVKEAIAEYKKEPSKFEIQTVSNMIAAQQNNFQDYFEKTENDSLGKGLKEGYVAHTVFWIIDNNKYIGTFNLRHALTENLKKAGGHIAYQIRPSEQGKGYAYKGLKLCLKEAKNRGFDKVLITCETDNIASYGLMQKVLQEYGGSEDNPVDCGEYISNRVWINTSK